MLSFALGFSFGDVLMVLVAIVFLNLVVNYGVKYVP